TNGLKLLTVEQQADGNAIFTTIQQFAGAMGTAIVAAIIGQSQNGALKTTIATAIGSQHAFYFLLVLLVIELVVLGKVILWPRQLDKAAK
ncbi:MAG: MFS transporter, partial [Bacillota bacterium]|nr:MFS transporter [Bacillota bacterium]